MCGGGAALVHGILLPFHEAINVCHCPVQTAWQKVSMVCIPATFSKMTRTTETHQAVIVVLGCDVHPVQTFLFDFIVFKFCFIAAVWLSSLVHVKEQLEQPLTDFVPCLLKNQNRKGEKLDSKP